VSAATALEQELHEEMIGLYTEAKKDGYTASAFLDMVYRVGGLAAANALVDAGQYGLRPKRVSA
jgi:hypothetical protein